MTQIRIFISYRRDDSEGYVGRLYDHLVEKFGKDHVFLDVDTIKPGKDIRAEIEQAVLLCDVLIAVIGPQWIMADDGSGKRRLDDSEDYVRLEIATALKRNILVIPTLVHKAKSPTRNELPADLSLLAGRNAIDISHERFYYDFERLSEAINRSAIISSSSSHQEIVIPDNPNPLPQSTYLPIIKDIDRSFNTSKLPKISKEIQSEQWDTTREKVAHLLGGAYGSRINHIREYVRDFWKMIKYSGYLAFHDEDYCREVEDSIYKLIPLVNSVIPLNRSLNETPISPEQWFYLIAAAWLQDIGMATNIFIEDPIQGKISNDFEHARSVHNLRSQQYIKEHLQNLGLNEFEADNIGIICEYHRKSLDINRCPEGSTDVNLPLLCAYLRLADVISINHERVKDDLKFLEFIKIPEEDKFHWIKSEWILDVVPDPSKLTIKIIFKFSHIDINNGILINDMICNEVKAELHKVRDILIKGGISYYLDVETTDAGNNLSENLKRLFHQIINNIQLDTCISAEDVVTSLIESILYFDSFENKIEALDALVAFREHAIRNIKIRRCNIIIDKIFTIIDASLNLNGVEPEVIFANIISDILILRENREIAFKKIAEIAQPILSDYGTILLFGRSSLVLHALSLAKEDAKRKTKIYVCEGRNLDQYSNLNDLSYCDGMVYAKSLKHLGFIDVKLIPDILVGNLFGEN